MIKVNLQLLAHKMGMGSSRNGRDSKSKRLGASFRMGNSAQRAASSTASGEPKSIRASM